MCYNTPQTGDLTLKLAKITYKNGMKVPGTGLSQFLNETNINFCHSQSFSFCLRLL